MLSKNSYIRFGITNPVHVNLTKLRIMTSLVTQVKNFEKLLKCQVFVCIWGWNTSKRAQKEKMNVIIGLQERSVEHQLGFLAITHQSSSWSSHVFFIHFFKGGNSYMLCEQCSLLSHEEWAPLCQNSFSFGLESILLLFLYVVVSQFYPSFLSFSFFIPALPCSQSLAPLCIPIVPVPPHSKYQGFSCNCISLFFQQTNNI